MKKYWRKNKSVDSRQLTVGKVREDFFGLFAYCLLIIAYCLMASCSRNKKQAEETYTCPMHPTVARDKPGTCPICGMELVRKGKPGEELIITAKLDYLLKPVNSIIISSIKTVTPVRKSMNIETKANGIITYDTRTMTTISSRFSGRIEKLFVKYNLQQVHRGQKIMEIYSPELITVQRDLLYLLKSDKENSQLIDGAKEKLRLLGSSDEQINQLISTRVESNSFGVYSTAEGYLINSKEDFDNQELDVREGMYITAGEAILKIVNAKNVWAEFDLFSNDGALVKVGDRIQIKLETTDEIETQINFVQPFYKEGQSFTKVRVYLSNANGQFRPGQLVSASFHKNSRESFWIPLSAQLNLGTRTIVLVKRSGVFEPKEITAGNQSDNWIEVLNGINVTDSIAYNAQFMIDSESFIKINK